MQSLNRDGSWVLLVDDHEDGRELLGEFLTFNGYTVATCASGEEALELIEKRGAPGVVVTDLTLGAMSGTELARKLRERDATASVPVIAVTGHAGFEDEDSLFAAVFVKPVALSELATRLRWVMGEKGTSAMTATSAQ